MFAVFRLAKFAVALGLSLPLLRFFRLSQLTSHFTRAHLRRAGVDVCLDRLKRVDFRTGLGVSLRAKAVHTANILAATDISLVLRRCNAGAYLRLIEVDAQTLLHLLLRFALFLRSEQRHFLDLALRVVHSVDRLGLDPTER